MLALLFMWFVLFAALLVVVIRRAGNSGALVLSYFLGLSLIHVPGLLAHFGDEGSISRDATKLGFELTLAGMAALVVGAALASALRRGRRPISKRQLPHSAYDRQGWRMIGVGAVAYFVFIPLSFSIPSLTSVVAPFGSLLILGLWLRLYGARQLGDGQRTFAILALLPLLPLATLTGGGFLGFGINWLLSVIAFLFAIARRRRWFYLTAPAAVFLGLSLFVSYMGQRGGIRELEWQQNGGLLERLDRISDIITQFEFLDLNNPAHVAQLEGRLNQNLLVAAAIQRHQDGLTNFAYGRTVPLWGFVPRALWPEKPDIGGGRNVIEMFTGLPSGDNTSVGAGQVLEFYVNFGMRGVLVGFAALGFLLMRLDLGIMRALATENVQLLLVLAMPGLTLVQPGGNLLEIVIAVVSAVIGAQWVGRSAVFDLKPPGVAISALHLSSRRIFSRTNP